MSCTRRGVLRHRSMYSPATAWSPRSRDMRSSATNSPPTAPSAIAAKVTPTVIWMPCKRYGRFEVTTPRFRFTERSGLQPGATGRIRTALLRLQHELELAVLLERRAELILHVRDNRLEELLELGVPVVEGHANRDRDVGILDAAVGPTRDDLELRVLVDHQVRARRIERGGVDAFGQHILEPVCPGDRHDDAVDLRLLVLGHERMLGAGALPDGG